MTTRTTLPQHVTNLAGGLSDRSRFNPQMQSALGRTAGHTSYFESTLSVLPGLNLPLRSMLVGGEGRQFLISPVGTADEARQVTSEPLLVLAPSLLHHVHVQQAIERYRPVALWGPPGFAEKKPELGPVHTFGVDPWPHGEQLAFTVVEGAPRRNEVVFFHPASRTIYTADLVFNIHHADGWLSALALRMMGIYRRFASARMWKHWVTDRAAFSRSIDQILSWDFDRIVMSHGTPIEGAARERLEIALRELGLLD